MNDDDVFVGFLLGIVVAVIIIGLALGIVEPIDLAVSDVIDYIGEVLDTGNCTNQFLDELGPDSKDMAVRFVLERGLCTE